MGQPRNTPSATAAAELLERLADPAVGELVTATGDAKLRSLYAALMGRTVRVRDTRSPSAASG